MTTIEVDNGGQKERYTLNKYAQSSDISIMQQVGGSMILCTICIDYENPTREDFLPLTIQYLEKSYAVGKIPQGYVKREGKPSESEILVSRLVDRSLRPLFPKNFDYPTQISLLVLSHDGKSDVGRDALNLAGLTLFCSSIPLQCDFVPSCARVVRHQHLSIARNLTSLKDSSLDLFVSGLLDDSGNGEAVRLTMIEMQALKTMGLDSDEEQSNEISRESLLQAIEVARDQISQSSRIYTANFRPFVREKRYLDYAPDCMADLEGDLLDNFGDEIKAGLSADSKSERNTEFKKLAIKIWEERAAKDPELDYYQIEAALYRARRALMRRLILQGEKRADGRAPKQIRSISIESNILPCVHGSSCFTRGETQALVSCTLGGDNDSQAKDSILSRKKRIMFHYNFPPFCVGEAAPIGASSRREIGHGNLALKAIESNIDTPYTVRLVSEILQSNGSSSMASVCGATLALLGAGVKMHNMVAGLALGLVYENENNFVVLSDIMGLEDHCGDMDLKVAGNERGITAMQLDIKLSSISLSVIAQSLAQAQEGLVYILGHMREVSIRPNYELLPQTISFTVPPSRIPEIIGQGGKTIKEIIAKFKISADMKKENGLVSLTGSSKSVLEDAKEYILELVKRRDRHDSPYLPYNTDEVFFGVVKRILDFGIFVELPRGGDGLLRTTKPTNMTVGESFKVRVISNRNGRIELDFG